MVFFSSSSCSVSVLPDDSRSSFFDHAQTACGLGGKVCGQSLCLSLQVFVINAAPDHSPVFCLLGWQFVAQQSQALRTHQAWA